MKRIKYAFIGSRKAHTVRAEKALGHRLPQKAVVHHPDEDSLNPNARLVICQDNAHHGFCAISHSIDRALSFMSCLRCVESSQAAKNAGNENQRPATRTLDKAKR